MRQCAIIRISLRDSQVENTYCAAKPTDYKYNNNIFGFNQIYFRVFCRLWEDKVKYDPGYTQNWEGERLWDNAQN